MKTFLLTDDVKDLYVPEGDKRRVSWEEGDQYTSLELAGRDERKRVYVQPSSVMNIHEQRLWTG